MRLIDADALKVHISNELGLTSYGAAVFKEIVNAQPTVNPVNHGHWIEIGEDCFECSECKKHALYEMIEDDDSTASLSDYCPHCGARMELLLENETSDK